MDHPLSKYARIIKADDSGAPLYWGRADVDGAPYRGQPTLLKEEEYESRVSRVADVKNATLHLKDPTDNAKYLSILDKACAGWYQILYRDLWRVEGDNYHHVYIEWTEYHMEDVKSGFTKLAGTPYGQQDG